MDSRGFSLVEAIFSMAILSVMVVSSFGVAGFVAGHDRRALEGNEEAINAVQALSDTLGNYVTADYSENLVGYAPVNPLLAPDAMRPPANRSWNLPGDGCFYALAAKDACPEHNGSLFLSSRFLSLYPEARLTYVVSGSGSPDAPIEVTYTITWNR